MSKNLAKQWATAVGIFFTLCGFPLSLTGPFTVWGVTQGGLEGSEIIVHFLASCAVTVIFVALGGLIDGIISLWLKNKKMEMVAEYLLVSAVIILVNAFWVDKIFPLVIIGVISAATFIGYSWLVFRKYSDLLENDQ